MISLSRIAAISLSCASLVAFAATDEAVKAPPPRVQIALLLDNSGSMEGLINQARTQMWKVVNEFATSKQRGHAIRLELALYEYGETPKRLSAFTTNLDAVSEQLFNLGIRGGDEYCGQVISKATQELEWSGNPDDLKLIYIAGNEAFTQGPVNPATAIEQAKKKGIVVNVINADTSVDSTWVQGAKVAGTQFIQINHNARVAAVIAPQDSALAKLGAQLNGTYVGYGAQGGAGLSRQAKMDEDAASAAPAAAAERTVSKGSMNYKNGDWDLVDAARDGKKVGAMKTEELPAEMRKMDEKQREAYVAGKAKEREELQQKISKLSAERDQFIAAKEKAEADAPSTLDTAMIQSVRSAAAAKAMTVK
jgi:hypothetical protein